MLRTYQIRANYDQFDSIGRFSVEKNIIRHDVSVGDREDSKLRYIYTRPAVHTRANARASESDRLS